jgi:capsular exopolysaccharide synthesis family protein
LLYAALSAIVGLIIATAAVLLIDHLDDTLKSPRKVKDVLGIPVLGEILEAAPNNKVKRFWPAKPSSPSVLNAFGILRIRVGRLIASKSLKTILITSPSLGEGKTTIAANLAAAFVRLGKRVVLIDADLYHPSLHTRLGLDNEKGLMDVLARNVDWQELLRDFGGIHLMTSGPQTPASAALLESDNMTKLLEQLQNNFDLIIIDGPPLFVEDTQILASKVGGVLLVVRLGGTISVSARAMLDQLQLIGANVLGVALNRVPRADSYYFNRNRDREEKKLDKTLEKVDTAQS